MVCLHLVITGQARRAIDTAIKYGFDDAATVLLVESEMDFQQEDLDVRYF